MQKHTFLKLFTPFLFVFFIINTPLFAFTDKLQSLKINPLVIAGGNAILFILAAITLAMHIKASKNSNPNVLVRSIMGAMLIKLMVIGTAALLYLVLSKENRNIPAIAIVMGLYIVYTVLEVKAALQLNKKQPTNASN